MQFYEKLDFLMKLTNTTNSALSLHIKLDSSHISRIRRGKRSALKDITCIKSMAAYFARNCKEEYQRKALVETLKLIDVGAKSDELSEHITKWLIDEKSAETTAVGNFLTGFSNLNSRQASSDINQQANATDEYPKADFSVYYGVEGKRKAAIYFLLEVIAQNKPQTLLLYSDEATDWMTADRGFAAKWASLMTQLLFKGTE